MYVISVLATVWVMGIPQSRPSCGCVEVCGGGTVLLFYLNLRGLKLVWEHEWFFISIFWSCYWLLYFFQKMMEYWSDMMGLGFNSLITAHQVKPSDRQGIKFLKSRWPYTRILTCSTEQFVKKHSTLFVDFIANGLLGIHHVELLAWRTHFKWSFPLERCAVLGAMILQHLRFFPFIHPTLAVPEFLIILNPDQTWTLLIYLLVSWCHFGREDSWDLFKYDCGMNRELPR